MPGWDLRRGHQPCVGCFNSMFSWRDVCQATNRIRASLFHSNPMAFYQGYQMSDRTRPSSCQSSWFSNKGGSCPQWKTNPRKKGGFSSRNFLTISIMIIHDHSLSTWFLFSPTKHLVQWNHRQFHLDSSAASAKIKSLAACSKRAALQR